MKDAKGHGSNPRGTHSIGIESIAGPEHVVPINSLRPRPENTAMLKKMDQVETARENAFKVAYPGESYTRTGPSEDIEKYRAAIRSGAKFPPLAINSDGSIEDGERRWRALKAEGVKQVLVRTLR